MGGETQLFAGPQPATAHLGTGRSHRHCVCVGQGDGELLDGIKSLTNLRGERLFIHNMEVFPRNKTQVKRVLAHIQRRESGILV